LCFWRTNKLLADIAKQSTITAHITKTDTTQLEFNVVHDDSNRKTINHKVELNWSLESN
jgi:hypothetical protein